MYTYNQFLVQCLIILEIFEILITYILFSTNSDESDLGLVNFCSTSFPF